MMKKFNETMIIRNGKLVYAVQLRQYGNSDKCFIFIDDGKIRFSESYFGTTEFDFNNTVHNIAKEVFISQLQTDIKTRVLELKQLEELFNELNLSECLQDIIPNSAKLLTKVTEEMQKQLDSKLIDFNEQLGNKISQKIDEDIRPIAKKKSKKKKEEI